MNRPLRLKRYANGQAALPESNAQANVWVKEYVASIDSLSARWNDGDHTRQRPADLLREFGEDDDAFLRRMVTWLHANPANPFATLATSDPEGHRQAIVDHQAEAATLPPLPFAVFDEFGNGCEDRVRDHFAAAFAAQAARNGHA